jgi:hypothetical protein
MQDGAFTRLLYDMMNMGSQNENKCEVNEDSSP